MSISLNYSALHPTSQNSAANSKRCKANLRSQRSRTAMQWQWNLKEKLSINAVGVRSRLKSPKERRLKAEAWPWIECSNIFVPGLSKFLIFNCPPTSRLIAFHDVLRCLFCLLLLPLSLSRFRFDASNLRPPRSSIPSTVSTLAVPEPVPPVADDCEQLQKAFAEWGTNEKLIISILGHRNAVQRKLIRQTYAKTYGKDLLSASDRELTNDFERLVVLWTLDPAERDAYLVN